MTLYDKLIYALKNMSNWSRMPDALKDQVFEHLAKLAAVANLSEENRIAYDKAVDRYSVSQIVEEDERRAAEERCRIALEEGTRKGIEKGIKEGRKEEQYNIARQMKNDGVPVNSIIKYTGLAIEEIEQL